jgi:hypothetical protein
MVDTHEKVKLSLDETRLLVLGAQILLGFQFRAFLEPGFQRLPRLSQDLRLASLGVMLVTILVLMRPTAYHQIAEEGELSARMLRLSSAAMGIAALPFALAVGIDLYTVSQKLGDAIGLAAGAGSFLAALVFWYVWEYVVRSRNKARPRQQEIAATATPLDKKIDAVLTECRIVIPGSQALLGFQLIAMLMDAFDRLPASSKYVHLASLLMITLSTILLMAPAAFHRIVEQGEYTVRFWRFARTMLLAAMAALGAGIATEFFVVMRLVTQRVAPSLACAALNLAAFYGIWFGYSWYVRARSDRR